MARKGKVSRKTKETSISVEVKIDGKGKYQMTNSAAARHRLILMPLREGARHAAWPRHKAQSREIRANQTKQVQQGSAPCG